MLLTDTCYTQVLNRVTDAYWDKINNVSYWIDNF